MIPKPSLVLLRWPLQKRKPDKNPALINTIYYEKTGVKLLSEALKKHDDNHLKT